MSRFLFIFMGLCALVLGLYSALQMKEPHQVQALWYEQPRALAPFSLSDQHGRAFDLSRLKGKWTLLFLGYTSCPDICPTTLSRLAAVYPRLVEAAEAPVQVALVTADPARDTQAVLREYVAFFNPGFLALRGEHVDLYPFTRQLGLMYQFDEHGDVSHSSSLVLVNPDGAVEAVIQPGEMGGLPVVDTEALVSDFEVIAAGR
ncbi:SCO family protein [Gallaecimonas sp. GXIMD4217]|uniref:SCO family protein n=1 Tax=Gallaecimonas sp. GXIMD4217 TaxID=3131927 RepID=UPI00311B2E1B